MIKEMGLLLKCLFRFLSKAVTASDSPSVVFVIQRGVCNIATRITVFCTTVNVVPPNLSYTKNLISNKIKRKDTCKQGNYFI